MISFSSHIATTSRVATRHARKRARLMMPLLFDAPFSSRYDSHRHASASYYLISRLLVFMPC